jgi:hypothetical protein
LFFTVIFFGKPVTVGFLSLLDPLIHVLGIRLIVVSLLHLLFAYLLGELVIELLMLEAILVFPIYILQVSLLILFNTLLNVLFFLLEHQLLIIVPNGITHAIHDCLDALAPIGHCLFARFFLIKGKSHVHFNLLLILSFDGFELSHSLLLLVHIFPDDAHCSLTLLNLLGSLRVLLFNDVCC